MDTKVTWQQGLSFHGAVPSGFTVPLGAAADVGGKEDGFRPMELIGTGLAGCTAMDVISILQKKRQEVNSFEVEVHAERAEDHPKVFTQAVITYHVTGHDVSEAAVRRAIELSALRYCPAQAMFKDVFPIELVYHIYEGDSPERRELVISGTFQPEVVEN